MAQLYSALTQQDHELKSGIKNTQHLAFNSQSNMIQTRLVSISTSRAFINSQRSSKLSLSLRRFSTSPSHLQRLPVQISGQGSGTIQTISVKDKPYTFSTDTYKVIGGQDSHPSPVAYALASLSSCNQVTGALVAKDHGLTLGKWRVSVEGQLPTAVLVGGEQGNPNWESVDLEVILFPLLAASAVAEVHYLFSGFFSGSTIAGIEFDDEAHSLSLVKNISSASDDGSKWIALDAHKHNLYVGTTGYFQSYKVTKDLGLTYKGNVSLSSDCNNANFITASSKSPFAVFGTPYGGGCPTVAISVDKTGTLQKVFANATYNTKGGVHGTALSPKNDFLYSADDMGNAVWAHSYDRESGKIEEVQYLAADEGSNPRHLTVHPNEKWVYVVYEEANSIAAYKRDTKTGKLEFRNETYSLLPSGFTNSSSYWADEVLLSTPAEGSSPRYLLAATRSRKTGVPGYVSAFRLDEKTGGIKEQLFLQETTNSGGSANAVSPAPFSEDFFAITDSGSNFIEVWKIKGKSASAVAHLDLENGPANAVWYN
ncbi:hypothetical protein FOVSG1_011219 [Fusarium oxysporum f. sp. vasinfectum]